MFAVPPFLLVLHRLFQVRFPLLPLFQQFNWVLTIDQVLRVDEIIIHERQMGLCCYNITSES